MYQGADGISFPSGHSTLATVIFGMLALFLAQSLPARFRGLVYGSSAALIALIGLSRVYPQAHWPSDVLAGMLFGVLWSASWPCCCMRGSWPFRGGRVLPC